MNTVIFKYLSLTCIGISLGHVQGQSGINVDELSACEHVSYQIDVLKSGNENLKLRLEMMDHHFERQRKHQHEAQRKFHALEEMIQQFQLGLLEQGNDHQNELKQLLASMGGQGCAPDQSKSLDNAENPEILREFQKVSKLQEEILTKLDTKCSSSKKSIKLDGEGVANENVNAIEIEGVNVCWGIYTKILGELNSNLTILQNIDSKLNKLNEHYEDESEKHKKSISITHGLLKFLNKKGNWVWQEFFRTYYKISVSSTEDSKICVRSNDQKLLCTDEPYPTSCADYDTTHCSNGKCRIKNILYGSETILVPCDDSTDGGGWTIIQRRINGSEDFYRGWSEYKAGFGNLDGEFWIGLDKLHALTASLAPVELLIQLKDHNDTLKYAKYAKFSIGSELGKYELKEADGYEGNAGDSFGPHKGCKFSTKDNNNDNDLDSSYNCAVIKRGAWWYNNCQWSNLNGFYYKTGYVPKDETGAGINWGRFNGYNYSLNTAEPYPTSCADYDTTHCSNGKCRIKNLLYGSETILVPCDDATDGGGCTIIQRHINGSVHFYRGWSEYKTGFGNLDGEFWIGLDKIHALTASLAPVELLIQLQDHNDTLKYAKYGKFSIGSELDKYELNEADGYEGNAGDSFGPHKGSKFSTKDNNNDNDLDRSYGCAEDKRGAWWYNNCQWSNLNMMYYKTGVVPNNETARGVNWDLFHGYNYSLKFVQMMIRPHKG